MSDSESESVDEGRNENVRVVQLRNQILGREKSGEEITSGLPLVRIPIVQIKEDHDFTNIRQEIDRDKIESLKESIARDGLETPLVVRASDRNLDINTIFWIRAGFRRLRAIQELQWEKVVAVVIPAGSPGIDDYWINLTENCQREKVTPYEIACQAKLLISRHEVSHFDVAKRAGVDPAKLKSWIRCVDYLPDEVLQAWKNQHTALTERKLSEFSFMSPWTARDQWRIYQGKMPNDIAFAPGLAKRRKIRKIRVAPFEKMQDLHGAVAVSGKLDEDTRRLMLSCIEICMGDSRRTIPDVWPRSVRFKIGGKKFWPKELDLPDHGTAEIFPPTEGGGKSVMRMIDDEDQPVQNRTKREEIRATARASRSAKR